MCPRKNQKSDLSPRARARKGAIGAAALLTAVALAAGPASAGFSALERQRVGRSGIVDASLVDALEAQDTVRVMILFSAPEPATGGAAAAQRGRRPQPQRLLELAARGQAVIDSLSPGSFQLHRRYTAIPALAGLLDARGLLELLDNLDVEGVGIDHPVTAQLAEAVPLVDLDWLHEKDWTGQGIQVATLDTGVDSSHPALSDAVVAEQCFCRGSAGPSGCCPNGWETQSGSGAAVDGHGHGTRVAGIVTSSNTAVPEGGAPDAEVVAVKVLSDQGGGYASDTVAGLDWIIANRPDVDVINISLGGGLYTGDCDAADTSTEAYATAIDTLWQNGVLTVAGSGNDGSGTRMLAPACIAKALSVGAVWDSDVGSRSVLGCTDSTTQADQVTCFSNSNSSTDIFAPGALMTSTKAGGGPSTSWGTSYATPLVSACAAVLLEISPLLTPAELETAMEGSPTLVTDATNGLSFPRLDCRSAAISLAVPLPALSGRSTAILAIVLVGACLWALRPSPVADP